jgi:hypothetical protein
MWLGLLLMSTGCSVLRDLHWTINDEFHYQYSNRAIERRMEQWANDAWISTTESQPELRANVDFEHGFKAGFVRYLRTGRMEDPGLLPNKYMSARFVNWEGHLAIEQWIQGYSFGSAAAADSGCRELVKVPYMGTGLAPTYPKPVNVSEYRPTDNQPADAESGPKSPAQLPPPVEAALFPTSAAILDSGAGLRDTNVMRTGWTEEFRNNKSALPVAGLPTGQLRISHETASDKLTPMSGTGVLSRLPRVDGIEWPSFTKE